MVILLDTSAWIEIFQDTDKGKVVEQIVRNNETFSSAATFTEIVHWCWRNGLERRIMDYLDVIKKCSKVLPVSEEICIAAGMLNFERKRIKQKWGMLDSIILATAQKYGLKIVTKDHDYEDLPDTEVL